MRWAKKFMKQKLLVNICLAGVQNLRPFGVFSVIQE